MWGFLVVIKWGYGYLSIGELINMTHLFMNMLNFKYIFNNQIRKVGTNLWLLKLQTATKNLLEHWWVFFFFISWLLFQPYASKTSYILYDNVEIIIILILKILKKYIALQVLFLNNAFVIRAIIFLEEKKKKKTVCGFGEL